MIINRRSFLQSLVAGASLVGFTSGAGASLLGNRYQRLIDAQATTIESTKLFRELALSRFGALILSAPDRQALLEQMKEECGIYRNMIAVLTVLETDFGDRSPLIVDHDAVNLRVKGLMRAPSKIDTMSEDDLSKLEDILVNIAVMMSMVTRHNVPIDNGPKFFSANQEACAEKWLAFADNYRSVIL
jgi:hypothetical protein